MNIDFFPKNCQTSSDKKLFGLCDDPPPAKNPAYIDEDDGRKWIAIVENEYLHEVTFTAVDNCVKTVRPDGKPDSRCDGVLTYNNVVIFVELKERPAMGNAWVVDAEGQLRTTIGHFIGTEVSAYFKVKQAYIANSGHPKFKTTQTARMDRFFKETGYVLRIVNRIKID